MRLLIISIGEYMIARWFIAASLMVLTGCAVQSVRPAPAGVAARLAQVESRLAALQLTSVDANSYAFAKAHAWYEFAHDVYAQGDRSATAGQALDEAGAILQAVEQHGGPVHVQAPAHITRAVRLREDLWRTLATVEQHPRFACAQSEAARLRVQLIAAGNAHYELGWRHAKPYVQAAERYARAAQAQTMHCDAGPAQLEPGAASAEDATQPARLTPNAVSQPLPPLPLDLDQDKAIRR
jgi:OmpA-OmpF porin, OOP family